MLLTLGGTPWTGLPLIRGLFLHRIRRNTEIWIQRHAARGLRSHVVKFLSGVRL